MKLIDCSLGIINKKFDDLKNFGFLDNDLIKIVSYLPKIILGDLTDINEEFSYLINYGYSEIDIINIVKKIPMILGSGHLDEVNSKIKCLEDFGFLKDTIYLWLFKMEIK